MAICLLSHPIVTPLLKHLYKVSRMKLSLYTSLESTTDLKAAASQFNYYFLGSINCQSTESLLKFKG